MVSTLSREEKFNQVRRNFCFYLDIQEHDLARSISRRLQDMGLQQEAVLSARVTHVVRSGRGAPARPAWRREGRARAEAMLQRVRCTPTPHDYVLLTVDKAISLLDKLYDTFFTAPRKANVRLFSKHFIKIEFLDKKCRPLYKEFDELPEISLEPNPPRDKDKKPEPLKQVVTVNNNYHNTAQQDDMTRKNRPRTNNKEEDGRGGGYWSGCGGPLADGAAHARAPRHAARAPPALNGQRRPRRSTYYKVVGVSTKLRSSGGFAPKPSPKESPPPPPVCNGAKPLVVKFRKVRRSELSVLSDEAEQFMFPKRASSSSSGGDDDDDDEDREDREEQEQPPPALERRRQARPLALKEDSSEEDSWADHPRARKRRAPPAPRRTRRAPPTPDPPSTPPPPAPEPDPAVSPLREPPVERCMKWEDGRLTYTPAVEQLEFAFESVPRSEPWFDAFARQDLGARAVRDVPRCFQLYSNSPKLPYEMSQLPPLKPNCCALSSLTKPAARGAGAGAARIGTRGLRTAGKLRARAARAALDARPRKSPREHASTLAMLGSAGLRRAPDDAKSTASEDTEPRAERPEPAPAPTPEPGAAQQAEARLRQFLAEVFEDGEFEPPEGAAAAAGSWPLPRAPPDVPALVAGCDACDTLRRELAAAAGARRARRRGRVKKNRTGWPSKRRPKKGSRAGSSDGRATGSSGRSSRASSDDPSTDADDKPAEHEAPNGHAGDAKDDKPLRLDVKVLLEGQKEKGKPAEGEGEGEGGSGSGEERLRRRSRALASLGSWLQPVVRVARVDPAAARRLRSAARAPRQR